VNLDTLVKAVTRDILEFLAILASLGIAEKADTLENLAIQEHLVTLEFLGTLEKADILDTQVFLDTLEFLDTAEQVDIVVYLVGQEILERWSVSLITQTTTLRKSVATTKC
jgi:hypothetical protein